MTALTLALPICDRCHRAARPALCRHCTAVLGQTAAVDQLRHAVEAATGHPLLDPDPDDRHTGREHADAAFRQTLAALDGDGGVPIESDALDARDQARRAAEDEARERWDQW